MATLSQKRGLVFPNKKRPRHQALTRCLKENAIEAPKIDMDRHCAIRRFRMCAGLMLRSIARKHGFVVLNRKKITASSAKKRRRKLQ